jgi:hypothetical protein
MAKSLQLEGFEGQNIEVVPAGFITPAKLLVDGLPAPKGKNFGENRLVRNDGREVIVKWKPQILDMPKLVVDGKTIDIVKPLHWYEWAWIALPILLIFTARAFAGFLGLIAYIVNAKIFRSDMSILSKYALSLLVSLLAALACYLLNPII